MTEPVHVLHVDDEPGFGELVGEFLQRESDYFEVSTVTSPNAGLDHLADTSQPVDCIVSDFDMPHMNGIEFLKTVREEHPDLPFILFTGKGSEEVASDAISAGATDYLQKGSGSDQYTVLANRVQNVVDQYRSQRRADEHERITEVIRNLNRALIYAESIEEIERNVCEILSDADPYLTACIAGVDAETMQIEPRTWAGDDADYFETLDMVVDPASPGRHAPGGRAYHDREIAISQDIPADEQYEPWREAATERGFQALAVIPLEYEEFHGLLAVFAARRYAFDDREKELLTELSDDIAHAMYAQEIQTDLRTRDRAIKNAQGGISILDEDGRYLFVNKAFADIHGYEPSELLGEHWERVYPDEEVPRVRQEILPVVEDVGNWYGETTSLRADGTTVEVDHTLAVTDQGELVCTVRDISEKNEREQQLQQSAARLEALFENSPDMINIHDIDGNIIDPNPRLCEKTGYDADTLTDMKIWELDQRINPTEARTLWESMEVGDRQRLEGEYQHKNGSTFPVEVHIRRLDLAGENQFIAISRDVTERRRTERKRQ